MADHTVPEPAPKQGDGVHLFDEVVKDFWNRKTHGLEVYGKTLQAFNGRRAGIDAYQEQMDNLLYLKQLNIELDAFGKLLDRLTEHHALDGYCCSTDGDDIGFHSQCTALAQIRVTAIQIGLIREE